jgi:hypothetical protein
LGQLKDQLRHDSLGCRTEIQATLERSQGIERIIQGLVFFDRVGAGGKEFAGPGNDRFFGVGYSRRNPSPCPSRIEQRYKALANSPA